MSCLPLVCHGPSTHHAKQERPLTFASGRFKKFFHGMLDAGVYLAPSQFESGFISVAHSPADIEQTVQTAAKVMKTL